MAVLFKKLRAPIITVSACRSIDYDRRRRGPVSCQVHATHQSHRRHTRPYVSAVSVIHFVARSSFHARRFPENAATIGTCSSYLIIHLLIDGSLSSYSRFQPLTVRMALAFHRRPSCYRNNNNVHDHLHRRTRVRWRRVGETFICFIRPTVCTVDHRRLFATPTNVCVCYFVSFFNYYYLPSNRPKHTRRTSRFTNKIIES